MTPNSATTLSAEADTHLALVRCMAGGLHVALEASKVQSMQTCSGPQQAPALAALLDLPEPATPSGRERLLSIAHPAGIRLLRVDEPVQHCQLPIGDLQPLPPLLAQSLHLPCVRALAWLGTAPDATLLIILDAWRLPVGYGASTPPP